LGMRRGSARRSGISTVVGIALFFILAFIVLSVLYAICLRTIHTVEQLLSIAKTKIIENELAQQISGWWLLQNGTLTINMTNLSPETVEITAISVVLSNGSYIALYRNHTLGATCKIVLPTGAEVSGALSLPLYLGSGYSIDIYIGGIVNNVTPVTISAALSASPGVAMIALKNVKYLHPTIVIRKVEILRPQILRIERTAGPYTSVWGGRAYIYTLQSIAGTPSIISVNASSWRGSSTDLETLDNRVLWLSSEKLYELSKPTSQPLYYSTFGTDPFTSGKLTILSGSWGWNSTAGVSDGGIYESSTQYATGYGGENIVLVNRIAPTTVYIEYFVYIEDTNGWYDTIFYINSSTFYTMGFYVYNTTSGYFDGYYYDNGWNEICYSNYVNIQLDRWYIVVVYFNASARTVIYSLYSTNGNLIVRSVCLIPAPDAVNINHVGLGSFTAAGRWDNLVVSTSNVTTVIIKNLSKGFSAEILNGSTVIAKAQAVNGTAKLLVLKTPILPNATIVIENSSGSVLLRTRTLVVGGESFSLLSIYGASISVEVSINSTAPVYRYTVMIHENTSIPVNATLSLVARTSSQTIVSRENVTMLSGNYSYTPPSSQLHTIYLKLSMRSRSPFNASIDLLNAYAQVFEERNTDALFVGVGGSKEIEVYQVSTTTGGLKLSYLYSLNSSLFNGLQYITYAPDLRELVLVNASGVYTRPVSPQLTWKEVANVCRITVVGGQAQVVEYGGSDVLIVFNGSRICVLNLSSGSLLYTATEPYSTYPFSCSTSNGTHAFFVLNSTQGPVLAIVWLSNGKPAISAVRIPFTQCVGASWSSSLGDLLLLGNGGPLYTYSKGELSTVSWVEPPYSPHAGDRLAAFGNYVVWIRDDSTSEVWVWPVTIR